MPVRDQLLRAFRNIAQCPDMALGSDNLWAQERDVIPNGEGWYWIKSTTPIDTFRRLVPPRGRHYNIPERVAHNQYLIASGIGLQPRRRGNLYVVYSGEAMNLRSRASEHRDGHDGTACLGIARYRLLGNHRWQFCFVSCRDLFPNCDDNKALRVYGEQLWRAHYGWPVLCKR